MEDYVANNDLVVIILNEIKVDDCVCGMISTM